MKNRTPPTLRLSDYDYDLPPERIAQTPIEPRDASLLLVLDRGSGHLTHTQFNRIGEYLQQGDLLVINQTRVIPARLYGKKTFTGGKVEILLLNRRDDQTWEILVGGKGMTVGKGIAFKGGLGAEVVEVLDGPRRLVRFDQPVESLLDSIGHTPLPPYIHEKLENPERYQTVYAEIPGSAAAPTAGLHFTPRLIEQLKDQGIQFAEVTLHVGLDTFAPVTEEDVTQHTIHTEWCRLPAETVEAINHTRQAGGRVVAVGTTSVRVIETGGNRGDKAGEVLPFEGPTNLYIYPGYPFQVVDAMITNFHLPRSTLLLLVSAFAGREAILQAYKTAIQEKYRFYSFGDAMLIV
ncbi:MAG: tRNA preQ1(34) S-adenosylmethionine ribosyltransferase-isomerase QueA [Anaerolineales bacterium]|jgi:S-adenosylmethionine:tRNA ribosyltransferase-isomerase